MFTWLFIIFTNIIFDILILYLILFILSRSKCWVDSIEWVWRRREKKKKDKRIVGDTFIILDKRVTVTPKENQHWGTLSENDNIKFFYMYITYKYDIDRCIE